MCAKTSMHAFDAPLHGKHISLREFSNKYDHDVSRQEGSTDDFQGNPSHWTLCRLFPVCGASVMTFVYGLRRETTDWGPQAALLHFFLSVFLTLRIYARLYAPEKTHAMWPSLALYATVMLFAYPYDTEKASVVVFCALLLCAGFYSTRCVHGRSLAANALTLLVLLNGLLCLVVCTQDSRVIDSYYHVSFASLCLFLVSF
jgi:hypothetical protein